MTAAASFRGLKSSSNSVASQLVSVVSFVKILGLKTICGSHVSIGKKIILNRQEFDKGISVGAIYVERISPKSINARVLQFQWTKSSKLFLRTEGCLLTFLLFQAAGAAGACERVPPLPKQTAFKIYEKNCQHTKSEHI